MDVADFLRGAVAVDQQRSLRRDRDVGLAAVADRRVEFGLACAAHFAVEHRAAQAHRARAVAGMALAFARGGGGVAAVQPGDAEPVVGLRPQRGEPVLGGRAVAMRAQRRAPVHAVVARGGEHDVVRVRARARLLQPLHPQRAAGQRQQVRRIGPVDEERAADGHGPGRLPDPVRAELGVLQAGTAAGHAFEPAQQQPAVGRPHQVGLGGARAGGQDPLLQPVLRRTRRAGGRVAAAAGGGQRRREQRRRPRRAGPNRLQDRLHGRRVTPAPSARYGLDDRP